MLRKRLLSGKKQKEVSEGKELLLQNQRRKGGG